MVKLFKNCRLQPSGTLLLSITLSTFCVATDNSSLAVSELSLKVFKKNEIVAVSGVTSFSLVPVTVTKGKSGSGDAVEKKQ